MSRVFISVFFTLLLVSCGSDIGSSESAPIGGVNGQGGSLARFAIGNDRLYAINNFTIKVFDITDCNNLVAKNDIEVGFGIETLFPYDDTMFIGAQDGMYIYNLQSRDNPQFLSFYSHFTACDPVVVQGDYAYVTLRVSECRPSQSWDALEIIDVSNKSNPVSISTYQLDEPYGLGVSGDLLFICEGKRGLKVLDVSDPFNIELVKQFSGIHAYDVIPNQNILILSGEDGIRQYDFSDPENIHLVSEIYSTSG